MVKLPNTILKEEIEAARLQGKHEIPLAQLLNRFQMEGYGPKKAKYWVNHLMELHMEYETDGIYLKF